MSATAFLPSHERLDVWQRAMELLVECYRIARLLPSEERYGLASQIRRAAVSVAANIAEGCGRSAAGDRLRFFSFSRGSLCEVRTLLAAVKMLGYVKSSDLERALDLTLGCGQLISGLRRSVRSRQNR